MRCTRAAIAARATRRGPRGRPCCGKSAAALFRGRRSRVRPRPRWSAPVAVDRAERRLRGRPPRRHGRRRRSSRSHGFQNARLQTKPWISTAPRRWPRGRWSGQRRASEKADCQQKTRGAAALSASHALDALKGAGATAHGSLAHDAIAERELERRERPHGNRSAPAFRRSAMAGDRLHRNFVPRPTAREAANRSPTIAGARATMGQLSHANQTRPAVP